MFKKSLFVLALTTLSTTAISAPVANLKVTGTITPPTCKIGGQDKVDVSYQFDITPGIFPPSGNLVLDAKAEKIEIICDAITYLTFDATDNRDGTALIESSTTFGLGSYGEGENSKKVGSYTITMQDATVQSDSSSVAKSVGVLSGTTYAATGIIDKNKKMGWAKSASDLAEGQIFAANFSVKPTINSEMKNTAGDAKLDGHAILAFSFGL